MKQLNRSTIKGLFLGAIFVLMVSFFFSSCKSGNKTGSNTEHRTDSVWIDTGHRYMHWVAISLAGTVKETWGGVVATHANDSILYLSGSHSFMDYTASNGTWSQKNVTYTGDSIYLVACANGELSGKFFNKALNTLSNDVAFENSVVGITALGGPSDTVLVKVYAQDTAGNAHTGAMVQFATGGVNFGTAATTGSDGSVLYPRGLAQNTVYTLTVTSTASSGHMVVSTVPLAGTSGLYSCMSVYVRY